jgi:hypothetical protein
MMIGPRGYEQLVSNFNYNFVRDFFFFFFFLVNTTNIIKLSDRDHITLSITKQPHNIRVKKG